MSKGDHNFDVDVVVIGGGLSGLSAAYRLIRKDSGLSVNVLEAKDRIGGRTVGQTIKSSNGNDQWDMGGQWIGKCQIHIMDLLGELGLSCYDQYVSGTKVMQLASNKVSHYKSDIPSLSLHSLIDLHLFMTKLDKMASKINVDNPMSHKCAAEWDSITFKSFLDKQLWTKGAREAVEAAGRTIFGQEPNQISLLYYLMYASAAGGLEPLISSKPGAGGQELKVKGGAFQICDRLLEKIGADKLHKNEAVLSITQETEGVEIKTTSGACYRCERVILAMPPSEIGKINFFPPLPIEKQFVLNRMPVGCLTKIIVTYEKAFWRDKGFSGEVVTNGGPARISGVSRGPLCVVFDATLPNGSPALVSFIGGDQQVEYAQQSFQMRKNATLHSLAEFFGSDALDCLEYAEKNWNEELYNGGCPVCVGTPGVISHISPGLRKPFEKIHFAGTESATVWCGFLNGAVQAGYRAANEVMYNLRPQAVSAQDLEFTCYAKPHTEKFPKQKSIVRPHHVIRWTVGLASIFVAIAVAKKAYFRMAL